jgi:hypothetical protein
VELTKTGLAALKMFDSEIAGQDITPGATGIAADH